MITRDAWNSAVDAIAAERDYDRFISVGIQIALGGLIISTLTKGVGTRGDLVVRPPSGPLVLLQATSLASPQLSTVLSRRPRIPQHPW